ncbi:hypothetical protein [Bradyrhizobium sp. SZCCHNRI20481]|nr:hypothetical protein [Bradyrhizobium sp. SZCCHNRI20481]
MLENSLEGPADCRFTSSAATFRHENGMRAKESHKVCFPHHEFAIAA